jgi:alkanesulfonate monooxygenase SsuD/methylene tetrahydromethanopterin reductase-like flavin-dependent oxidoreductase (luciferase family)
MRISIHVAHPAGAGDFHDVAAHLARVVTTAEDIGADTVWLADHLLRPDPAGPDPTGADTAGDFDGTAGSRPAGGDSADLEAYTVLGFLASRSSRVRLGAMASPVSYRTPELVVRAVATLDLLSGGRARLGAGPGHDVPHPPPSGAGFDGVEELLRLAHRTTRPPVMVSGHGETRLLPLVARYADAFTLLPSADAPATVRRKLDILAVHCRKVGRPPAAIDLSAGVTPRPGETTRELIARCREVAALGIGHVLLTPDGPWTPGLLGTVADAAPAIGELSAEPGPSAASTVTYLDAYRVPAVSIPV